ncbi:MAG TPA: MFS transporter, partial [Plasticicumulans sp.]|nr:MFS transporter [Plasticicumulans sp.]
MSDSVPAPLTAAEVRAVVLGSVLALFLAALDQSIVATALPAIAAELGRVELMSWVVTAYLLASTCATPVLGKASDVLGRRRVLAGCLIVFLGGSVLCSLATSMPMLIAARALQGLGGGGLITLAQATVADVVPPRERGRYVAYFASVWACAGLLGPTLGGLLTQYLGWPWIFWINLPLGLAALVITDRVLRRLPVRGGTRGRIDLPGIVLLSTATTALLLALSFGGHRWPWASAPILGLLALAVVPALLFAHRQRHTAEPLLPPAFFRDPVVAPTGAALFLVFGGFLAVAVLVPAWLQIGLGRGAAAAGLLMMPMSLAAPLTATATTPIPAPDLEAAPTLSSDDLAQERLARTEQLIRDADWI